MFMQNLGDYQSLWGQDTGISVIKKKQTLQMIPMFLCLFHLRILLKCRFQSVTWASELFFFIKMYLIYNIVSIFSAVQQNDSVTHTHIIFHILFFTMVYHRKLNIIPVLYSRTLFFIYCLYNCLSANPKLPIHPSPILLPFGSHRFVHYVMSLFLLHRQAHLCHLLPFTCVNMQFYSFSL